jgi:hypothetical protein
MKRYYPRFLVLILPLFLGFNAAQAQQNQPELVRFFSSSASYDAVKLNVEKTGIQMNLNNEVLYCRKCRDAQKTG